MIAMPEIHYEQVDHNLLTLMITLQQLSYQAAAINCTGTREFIFAIDDYARHIANEIAKQGT